MTKTPVAQLLISFYLTKKLISLADLQVTFEKCIQLITLSNVDDNIQYVVDGSLASSD